MGETRKLFSNSLIVILGTLVASVFSYLFNMLMGRMLGPQGYGEMSALLSLLMIISVIGGAISTVSMRYSSELFAKDNFSALKKFFSYFSKYIFYLSLILIFISLFVVKPISNYLSIEDVTPVLITLLSLLFLLPININRGFLQGVQNFRIAAALNVLEMAARLGLGILLVTLGFYVNGALSAVVLAVGISYLVSLLPIKKTFFSSKKDKTPTKFKFDRREIINYSWPTLISSIFLAISLNLDIILVKHYFSPFEAGTYAAISTIAKIILYVTAPVATVMFPMISERKTKGSKHYSIFLFSLLFVVIGSLLILGLYVIAPAKVISILYGSQYINFFYLLPEVGLALVLYSLVNLMVNYYLVIRDFTFVWFFALAIILEIIGIVFFHSSVIIVVRIMILCFSLLFASLFGYYLFGKRKQLRNFFMGKL